MSNWRKTLWQMPQEEPTENTFADDVKQYIITVIDPQFPQDEFSGWFQEFLNDVADTDINLSHILFYLKKGYNWFVKKSAYETYDYYNPNLDGGPDDLD